MRTLLAVCGLLVQCLPALSDEVVRIQAKTDAQVAALDSLAERLLLDVWQRPSLRSPTDIHVTPATKPALLETLRALGLGHQTIVKDLGKLIELERKANDLAKSMVLRRWRSSSSSRATVIGYFARHDEINNWLNSLAASESIASISSIGKSYEGRDMRVLKLSTGANRPAIFMDSGIHAREWLTVATVNHIIDKLIKAYNSNDNTARNLLSKFDIYFLPVANPDGYEYTFTHYRLWRKTRQPWGRCVGSDPNRNFDSHFGSSGTSNNPCSDIYRGPYPFSEPETANMRRFVLSIRSKLKLYLSTHSYSQFWLVPWAWTRTPPADDAELRRVANIGNNALASVNGVRFLVDSPPNILYSAAGGAYDWVKETAGVKYVYTFELRPGRNSFNGFVVPTSSIRPSGEEVYAGVVATANAIKL